MSLTAHDLGLDPRQLREYVVRPALKRLGAWTQAAENLVLGTAIHESRLRYLDQLDRAGKPGPAFGLWQMERATHDDIWANWLRYHDEPRVALLGLTANIARPQAEEMHGNLFYAAAMCRVFYLRLPDAIPDNALRQAALWKLKYNTWKGAGTIDEALPAFDLAWA